MRFIFGFIFFGLLFYAIWLYFPEAFATLFTWAQDVFNFFKDLVVGITDKFNHAEAPQNPTPPTGATPAPKG